MAPFRIDNLLNLLEYLATHGEDSPAFTTFSAKLTLETGNSYHDSLTEHLDAPFSDNESAEIDTITFRCTVEGVQGVADLFYHKPYAVEKVYWRGGSGSSGSNGGAHGNEVRIDCAAREIHISTSSISFIEICRHKMVGQNVRKITIDLKMS
jgi:hypothetical protein